MKSLKVFCIYFFLMMLSILTFTHPESPQTHIEPTLTHTESISSSKEETLLKTVIMEATAYTLEDGNGDGYTASMTIPKPGKTVAVDPKIIQLGTEIYIDGDGPFIAEDTGGAIKENRIDIFMGSGEEAREKALEFGRRQVEVKFVE